MKRTSMGWHRTGKAAALAVCLYASWAAWRGPPPRAIESPPSALLRTANLDTLQGLEDIAAAMTQEVQQARTESKTGNLESLLTEPIPDNPLVEGVGTTAQWCGHGVKPNEVDWIFCPQTGTVTVGSSAQ